MQTSFSNWSCTAPKRVTFNDTTFFCEYHSLLEGKQCNADIAAANLSNQEPQALTSYKQIVWTQMDPFNDQKDLAISTPVQLLQLPLMHTRHTVNSS